MQKSIQQKKYFSLDSYKKLNNLILALGYRGGGKSTYVRGLIKRLFEQKEHCFLWVTREVGDMTVDAKEICETWNDDVVFNEKRHRFTTKTGKTAGFIANLRKPNKAKRYGMRNYPIKTIVFDDILNEESGFIDRKDVVKAILSIIASALPNSIYFEDDPELKIIFLFNNTESSHPLFQELGYPKYSGITNAIAPNGMKVTYIVDDAEDALIEGVKKSQIGKLMSISSYSKFAYENEIYNKDDDIVFEMSLKKAIYVGSVLLGGYKVGCWKIHNSNNMYWLSANRVDNQSKKEIFLDEISLYKFKSHKHINTDFVKILKTMYHANKVKFDAPFIKDKLTKLIV